MTDQQRIKLLNLMGKVSFPSVKILDRYTQKKNSYEPHCFEIKDDDTRIYVGIVFGEILAYIAKDYIWYSSMDRVDHMTTKLREEIDKILYEKAWEIVQKTLPFPDDRKDNLKLLTKLIKEIENEKAKS